MVTIDLASTPVREATAHTQVRRRRHGPGSTMTLNGLRYTCTCVARESKTRESGQEGALPAAEEFDRPERTGNVTETATLKGAEATSTPASATATMSQTALDALLRDILPRQGHWNDEAYLWLTDHSRRRIEFTDGRIEELPLPTFTRPFWRSSIACFMPISCRVEARGCSRG